MTMESSDCKQKCKVLFDRVLSDKFELSAEHSENLLKYLDSSQDKNVAKFLETPFFANLLVDALQNGKLISTSAKVFVSKLAGIVLRNEVFFNWLIHLQCTNLPAVLGYTDLSAEAPDVLQLAMTQQTAALVAHNSGTKYVVDNDIFQKVLSPTTHHRPPEVATAIYQFIAKLTWRLNEYEEDKALLKVLNYITCPLRTYALSPLEEETLIDSNESLVPFLHTLVNVLGEVEHLMVPNSVVSILSKVFMIERTLTIALERTQDPLMARLLAETTVRFYYAASRQVALLHPDDESRVNQGFHEIVKTIMCTFIKKHSFLTILEFLCQCHVFWHRVEGIVTQVVFEKFGRKFLFQNQFVILLLVPLYVRQRFERLVSDPTLEDANEIFHSNLAETLPYDMVVVAYNFRDLIIQSTKNDLKSACTDALRQLLRLKRLLSRQQVTLVFRTLFYTLSQFVLSNGSDLVLVDNPLRTTEDEFLLEHIFDAIAMLLEEYEICWHESLEIVELQAALINLMKQNFLPVKLLVQGVKLVSTSVRKLLSPELTLQMESQRGGSLREAASVAQALLERPESTARCASLQLIRSFLKIAYVKYIPLRAVISAQRLVEGASDCALNDKDAHVQVAALRCLAEAACCEDLWTKLLEHCNNLYVWLVGMMHSNPVDEVRKEATVVLVHVYTNRKVTDTFTAYISKVMARAATEDPHWPVRIAALDFWIQHMKHQFSDRGMIDGNFPPVTFCKENKKIIVLNDKQIHKQLEIAMSRLSKTGSLGVLLKCMQSSNSRDVIKKAFELTNKLVVLLDRYKYNASPTVAKTTEVNAPHIVVTKRSQSQYDDGDLISEIFDCLSTDTSKEEDSSAIEVIQPRAFLEAFIEIAKKRPSKVNLGTLIGEILESNSRET